MFLIRLKSRVIEKKKDFFLQNWGNKKSINLQI